MSQKIRVFLVDDHVMVREGLKRVLEVDGGMVVVGEASDAMTALETLPSLECDVAVVDVSLPVRDGVWLTSRLRQVCPRVAVLALTLYPVDAAVRQALRAGAGGYLPKTCEAADLVRAVRDLHRNNFYLQAEMVCPILTELRSGGDTALAISLSQREREILGRVAAGFTNREIGEQLGLSESTVKSDLRGVYKRLSVTDRTQAILQAIDKGLIGPYTSSPS